jgi:hypothetical protein
MAASSAPSTVSRSSRNPMARLRVRRLARSRLVALTSALRSVPLGFQSCKFAHGQLPFLRLEQLPVHHGHASNIYLHGTLVQRY